MRLSSLLQQMIVSVEVQKATHAGVPVDELLLLSSEEITI